jgi:hypothetical protein
MRDKELPCLSYPNDPQCFRGGAGMRAGPANTDTAARRAGANQAARVDAVLYQRFGSIGRGSGFVGGVPGGFGGAGDGGSGVGLGVGG